MQHGSRSSSKSKKRDKKRHRSKSVRDKRRRGREKRRSRSRERRHRKDGRSRSTGSRKSSKKSRSKTVSATDNSPGSSLRCIGTQVISLHSVGDAMIGSMNGAILRCKAIKNSRGEILYVGAKKQATFRGAEGHLTGTLTCSYSSVRENHQYHCVRDDSW